MSFTRFLVSLLTAFILTFSALPIFAGEDFGDEFEGEDELADYYGDEDFVSIATGSKQLLHKAPSIASVITAEEIERMGARNLTQVLDTVPGLHVSRSGQLMAPEFWFRGITSTFNPQTLMMINGVSTKSSVRGDNHVVWGEFPIHMIQRIEIIRGPGSALYGADAFSGVINIITKSSSSKSANEVGGMVGSFNTKNLWINHNIELGGWQFATNLEYIESDGFKAIIESDAQTNIDVFAGTLGVPAVSLAPGPLFTEFKALDFWLTAENEMLKIDWGLLNKFDLGTRLGATEALDSHGLTSGYKNIIKLSLKERKVSDFFSYSSKLSFYASSQEVDEDFILFPPGSVFGAFPDGFIGNPEWKEETTKFELDFKYSGFEKFELLFGTGYERQNLYKVEEQKNFLPDFSPRPGGLEDVSDTAEVFMPEAVRDSHFFYAQLVNQIAPDWELTAGARFDDYSDFGSTLNPRVALVWSTSLKLTTKFLYGRAFRAPSFAELLVINNPVALGNPNIKPETIDTLEMAFNYKFSPEFSLDINIYEYKIKDFITFVPDQNGQTATAQNVGESTGLGFETSIDCSITEKIKILANMAYVKAEDDLVNDDVGEYPNFQSYLRAEWSISENWQLHTQINDVGKRERVPNDSRDQLRGYTTLDFTSIYQFSESDLSLEFTVNNAFDEDVREPSSAGTTFGAINVPNDLPQAGRAAYIRISTQF